MLKVTLYIEPSQGGPDKERDIREEMRREYEARWREQLEREDMQLREERERREESRQAQVSAIIDVFKAALSSGLFNPSKRFADDVYASVGAGRATGPVASASANPFAGVPPVPGPYAAKAPAPAEAPYVNPAHEDPAGPGPAPADPAVSAQAAAESRRQAKLTRGYEVFAGALNEWAVGFGDERCEEQPDRGAIIDRIANGPDAGAVLTYIMGCGGLRAAVRACLPQHKHLWDKLPEHIVQVASAKQFGELANLLEPRSL